jgi:hypothetical protein
MEELLEKITALRKDRETAARVAGSSPEQFKALLLCAVNPEKPAHINACRVLELVIPENPAFLNTGRKLLFSTFENARVGSAIRPLAKIIAFWTASERSDHSAYPKLQEEEIQRLTELCFSWLLADLPVAVKVFSMEALFQMGKSVTWVHPELREYILREFPASSPAFKARAKRILKALSK